MRSAALALWMALIAPAARPGDRPQEVRFTGLSAVDELCASLLDSRRDAEAQGRLDFIAEVESVGAGEKWPDPRIGPRFGRCVGASTLPAIPAWTTSLSAAR